MMKYVYRITDLRSSQTEGKKLLLANMLFWFFAGTAPALIFAATVGKGMGITADDIAGAGSFASLAGGYIGGALWLVNRGE